MTKLLEAQFEVGNQFTITHNWNRYIQHNNITHNISQVRAEGRERNHFGVYTTADGRRVNTEKSKREM